MSQKVRMNGTEFLFPSKCAACNAAAETNHRITKTLHYADSARTLELDIPMCIQHAHLATNRSSSEKVAWWVGFTLCINFALSVWAISFWVKGDPLMISSILSAGLLGLWSWCVWNWAKSFAPVTVKRARNAVRINKFWPAKELIELEFASDEYALGFMQINGVFDQR